MLTALLTAQCNLADELSRHPDKLDEVARSIAAERRLPYECVREVLPACTRTVEECLRACDQK